MKSKEIRSRFLAFFKKRGHAVIPSASLVPENDPSVLFTTAGMQPLVPYLLGAKHPEGNRLVNSQKCVRTQDIDEVGDNTHNTFFEMLGNWSLGDYFKKEAITWSYEFLTSKEEGLALDPKRLYVTVFGGNNDAPKDTESYKIWRSLGMPENHIYWMDGVLAEKNWWSPGDSGPCGPDTEMFYDVTGKLDLKTREEFLAADERQEVVEVWNDVFMEYEKKDGKVIGKLKQKNVDTGAGLERLSMVLQNTDNVFDTDLFKPLVAEIKKHAKNYDERAARIVADHIRTAVFMLGDGVTPSNTDRGYILRRIVRRAVRYADAVGISLDSPQDFVRCVIENYANAYQNLTEKEEVIVKEIQEEGNKFRKTLERGLKKIAEMGFYEFDKYDTLGNLVRPGDPTPKELFELYSTYGFPPELVIEELQKKEKELIDSGYMDEPWLTQQKINELINVTLNGFREEMKKHQALSRAGAEQKFKGGLADTNPKTVMLHTSTHLMLAALRKYLGDHVHQAGSNITSERTRFDFNHPEKVPPEILRKVEDYVNEAITKECSVVIETMPKEQAQREGVEGSFWEKYPDTVNVYMVKAKDLPAPRPNTYYVYVILCEDNSMYIGQTQDLQGRWKEHISGTASEHTKKFKPQWIIHYEEYSSREEAVMREKELKTGFGRKWLKREYEAGRTRQAGGTVYSRELCGGPHVKNTSEIGKFKIIKEEAVAAGIRRIKAVIE